MKNNKIEKARESIQPIVFEPNSTGFFVLQNGNDMGGSDYCQNCISAAVKDARKFCKEKRIEIIEKHNKAMISGKYSKKDVIKSKREQLKHYPAKSYFTYEGHDPDFGGGATSPHTCDGCGSPFQTEFTADEEAAENLLDMLKTNKLSEEQKWEIDIALYHYQYSNSAAQKTLMKLANKLLLIKK
jgi:hypothetical protein